MRMMVDFSGIQVDDVITKFRLGSGGWCQYHGVVTKKTKDSFYLNNNHFAYWYTTYMGAIDCEVDRPGAFVKAMQPVVNGWASLVKEAAERAAEPMQWVLPVSYLQPAPKQAISDWPHSCPRCGRSKSAYLGLNQYDCKHGCYK